jgi:hypothetical protein
MVVVVVVNRSSVPDPRGRLGLCGTDTEDDI